MGKIGCILLIVWAVLTGVFLFAWFLPPFFVALCMNRTLLTRRKGRWGRVCSDTKNPEQVKMHEEGIRWGQQHESCRKQVWIENDGLKLCAEYFDFGYDRCVILIPGRSESCLYSMYFAAPYEQAHYNVLAIDNRAHGLSEGKYDYLGFKECDDVLAWAELLHKEYHQDKIVLHGICIGAATALYALCKHQKDENALPAPSYLTAVVTDGMYTSFYDLFLNHLIAEKRPIYPFIWWYAWVFQMRCGYDFAHRGPVYYISELKCPILMLYSLKDQFATQDQCERLAKACQAPTTIRLFAEGAHSHVRYHNTEQYDQAIIDFLQANQDSDIR